MNNELRQLLEGVKSGEVSIDDAVLKIKRQPFDDLGFAKVDLHRKYRQGAAEVIFGSGKTAEQILAIAESMLKNGQETILITRLASEKAAELDGKLPMTYHETARIGVVGKMPQPDGTGTIVVATGGTSDSRGPPQAFGPSGRHHGRECHHRHRGHGRRVGQRHRRHGGLPGHRRAHERWLRCVVPWLVGSSFHVEFLRKRRSRGEYRQWFWCGLHGQYDQP